MIWITGQRPKLKWPKLDKGEVGCIFTHILFMLYGVIFIFCLQNIVAVLMCEIPQKMVP